VKHFDCGISPELPCGGSSLFFACTWLLASLLLFAVSGCLEWKELLWELPLAESSDVMLAIFLQPCNQTKPRATTLLIKAGDESEGLHTTESLQ